MKPEDELYCKEVGKRIRKEREGQKLTQEQLVQKIKKMSETGEGFAHSTLSRLETGQVKARSKTIGRIADALQVSPKALAPPRRKSYRRPDEATLSDIRGVLMSYPPLSNSVKTVDTLVNLIELYGFEAGKTGKKKSP